MADAFLLTSGNGGTFHNVFICENGILAKASTDYLIHQGFRHWFVEKYKGDGIEITNSSSLLEQIFDKDGYYVTQSEYKDWFQLLSFSVPAGKCFTRIYRPMFKTNHDSFIFSDRRSINELARKSMELQTTFPSQGRWRVLLLHSFRS